MSLQQIEWFSALDEGNIEKLRNLLADNPELLEEKNENQVILFTHFGEINIVDYI